MCPEDSISINGSLQHRRYAASVWTTENYILLDGQIGLEPVPAVEGVQQPHKWKIGNGTTPWNELPYMQGAAPSEKAIPTNTKTANYTIGIADNYKNVEMNVTTNNVVTIPHFDDVEFPDGSWIIITQKGEGETKVEASDGVTIFSAGGKAVLNERYSVAQLLKRGENSWYLYGDLRSPFAGLELVFDDISNVPVSNASDVADWNTFFDVGTNATNPFTSVVIIGNSVRLGGASALQIASSLFASNDHIRAITDTGEIVWNILANGFASSSIESVSLPVCTDCEDNMFANCTALSGAHLPALQYVRDAGFSGCTALTSISLEACTLLYNNAFQSCTSLVSINIINCTDLLANALNTCPALLALDCPGLLVIGASALLGCSSLTSISYPLCETVWANAFDSCSGLEIVSLPLCVDLSASAFIGCTALKTVDLSSCLNMGDSWNDDNVFNGIETLENITVPVALETANSGSPDGDLITALSNNPVLASNGITYV